MRPPRVPCKARAASARAVASAPGNAGTASPASSRNYGCSPGTDVSQVDVAVIGSGIGGLCAAALLARTGRSVAVLEAHSIPGGAAHHWQRGGYHFDSGAALFSGLTPPPTGGVTANPLSSVLAAIDEAVDAVDLPDSATCLVYPDGRQYRTQLASAEFSNVVRERLGARAAAEWGALQAEVRRLFDSAGAVHPMAVRLDNAVGRTVVMRRPFEFLRYALGSRSLVGKTFNTVVDSAVTMPEVRALVDMITEGTCSAASHEVDASYMVRAVAEMWSPGTQLQYPLGGSQAIAQALLRGIAKYGGHLMLRSPVSRIHRTLHPPYNAVAVECFNGRRIDVGEAVVSNASVWDTESLMQDGPMLEDFQEYGQALEMNDSMVHLHIGFERRKGEDLPMHTYFLESSYNGANGWPTIVIPSVPDPSLAPCGHHVLHATMASSYREWANLKRGSDEYEELKRVKGEVLMDLVRQTVPDIDDRLTMSYIGTPKSHARFLHRKNGTYGPKNLLTMAGALPTAVKPLENMYCCGDSVFPGVGTPAVASSGMWVANTIMGVDEHLQMLDDVKL